MNKILISTRCCLSLLKSTWKLGLLAFVICSVTLVPALDSAYGKTVRMTHTPTFVGEFSVNSQDTSPEGMAFNTDGTKMFIVGAIGDDVYEYACSTGFDVSTCSFTDTFSVVAQENAPNDLAFNTDGTKMFIVGPAGDDVNEYACTTGFDVSTCSFTDPF